MLPKKIYNTNKAYGNDRLLFGEDPGLFDSINVKYPDIDDLYRRIKANDWDRAEFSYYQDFKDFQKVDKSMYEAMLFNLLYQTEADSIASRAIYPVIAQVISNSELNAAMQALANQEVLHADSYAFAIRNCFQDPQGVIKEAEKLVQAYARLGVISRVFDEARIAAFNYSLGHYTEEDTYPEIMKMVVALYCLEAIQFINSFAITAAFWSANLFKGVGSMVRLIMRDEQIHAQLDRAVIKHELKTLEGQNWRHEYAGEIKMIVDEVVKSEREWTKFIFSDGRQVPGLNEEIVNKYISFISQGVYRTLGLEIPYKEVPKNPLPYMDRYADLSNNQASPQEQAERGGGSYVIGGFEDDSLEFDMEV